MKSDSPVFDGDEITWGLRPLHQWPTYLYKHYPAQSEREISRLRRVLSGWLYASRVTDFNDPFDCAPRIALHPERAMLRAHSEQYVRSAMAKQGQAQSRQAVRLAMRRVEEHGFDRIAKATLTSTVAEAGVTCFSARRDSMLMWGHYSASHRGVCLRFRLDRSLPFFMQALQVFYRRERPAFPWPNDDDMNILNDVFLSKADYWSYENEWRIIWQGGPGEFSFPPGLLDGVIFGSQCKPAYVETISGEVDAACSGPVEVLHAVLDDTSYRLGFRSGGVRGRR